MNTTRDLVIFLFAIGTAISATAVPTQAQLPMDERDMGKTQHRDAATSEWLKSWHTGEIYKTSAEYDFRGKMELDKDKGANWLQRRTVNNLDVIEEGAFFGKAISTTFVFHDNPHLRLVRDWQYVASFGAWSATATPRSEVLQGAIRKSVEGDYLGRDNRKRFYQILRFVSPVGAKILSTWGEGLWEVTEDWLKSNVGAFDREGRLVIAKDSPIGKALGADERRKLIEMAMAFSRNVNGKKAVIAQDGKYTRRVRELGSIDSTDADPFASVETFDKFYLAKGKKPHADLDALVKRESFSVTSELFDHDARKPGDIWVVDDDFFNSFLHPDLRGAFSGTAVVKYERDEEGDEAYQSVPGDAAGITRAYAVRKIAVIQHGAVGGADVATDLKYDERKVGGRFSAKYDGTRSDIFFLVDKKTGHVVYSEIKLFADDVEALPLLKLLEGFKASGGGELIMRFYGDVFFREEFADKGKK